jgi:hypothetical protein
MPSRPDVWLVGRALVFKLHTCILYPSYIFRLNKAYNDGVLYPL